MPTSFLLTLFLASSVPLLSSATRISEIADKAKQPGCTALKARILCSEQRPQQVFEKIGALQDGDLRCIGSLCTQEGSAHQCCGVVRSLAQAPIITQVQQTEENIAKQAKMQAFLKTYEDAANGRAQTNEQLQVQQQTSAAAAEKVAAVAKTKASEAEKEASKALNSTAAAEASQATAAATPVPTAKETKTRVAQGLSPGCKTIHATRLCMEHRPDHVFQAIGNLHQSDLACIGTLCEVKGKDNCCGVLRALAASPIINEKQLGDSNIKKQEAMQAFLDEYPLSPA